MHERFNGVGYFEQTSLVVQTGGFHKIEEDASVYQHAYGVDIFIP